MNKNMKKIFVIFAVAATLVGCNSHRVVINGDVLGVEDGTIYLTEPTRNGAVIDSTLISGGKFVFTLDDEAPEFYAIKGAEGVVTMLYTESGTITVAGNLDNSSVTVTGTTANEALGKFNEDMTLLNQRYAQAADDSEREAIRAEYDTFLASTVESNIGNIFGVSLLIDTKGYELTAAEMIAKLETLSEEMKALPVVARTIDKCNRKMKTEPKSDDSDFVPTYINIEQPNVDGHTVSLKSVVEKAGNKYVLLDFWASWCGPCMGEMPYLKQAYAKYHKKGFEIYGVSFDRNADAWKGAIKKQDMKWVNVSLLESFNNQAATDYVVESIPTNFLIDCSNGEIIAKNLRGEDVLEKLSTLL